MKLFLVACISVATAATAYAYHFVKIPPTLGLVESYALKHVNDRFRNSDYVRYKSSEAMSLGYDNRYLVSGRVIVVDIGKYSQSDYPKTTFQELQYFIIVRAYCAHMSSDCFELVSVNLSGEASTSPVL